MQTECPHCHTLFRVTEAQLSTAGGKVRCGFCKEVFEAVVEIDLNDDIRLDAFKNNQREKSDNEVIPDHAYLSGEANKIETEDFSEEGSARPVSNVATAAWSLAILALVFALAGEYIWFNRPQLLQQPGVKPIAETLCELTDCEHMQMRDPAQIEMISRNVYTHPNAKNALMISTTLVNHAAYAQPYPDVQIDFSNVRGELVASRRFAPEEYLQPDNDKPDLLQSGNPVSFGLEIKDPGKEAITYEFSFH
jgi:predicted Zn finger-like uncharacterized protein